jgi:hypothetical protein
VSTITEKLSKLLAMEEGARAIGNLKEAEAFAAKVQEVLFKYNLSMSDIEVEQQERDEPVGKGRIDFLETGTRTAWVESLGAAAATICFCKMYVVLNSSVLFFAGRESDRAAAIALLGHLMGCAKSVCNKEAREARQSNPFKENAHGWPGDSRIVSERNKWNARWRASFLLGFGNAIYTRVMADRMVLAAESSKSGAMVVRKEAAIAEWAKTQKSKRPRSMVARVDTAAYNAGVQAGQNTNLKARGALAG